jgi:hypothetical protein
MIEVNTDFYERLKEESEKQNQPLKEFCAEILEKFLDPVDPGIYHLLPLDTLRDTLVKISHDKPENWEIMANRVNQEINRRYCSWKFFK